MYIHLEIVLCRIFWELWRQKCTCVNLNDFFVDIEYQRNVKN